MASLSIPQVNLCNGHKIPILGMGTFASPPVESEAIKHAVLQAIKLGYRHFDTAVLYQSEQPLGEAIAQALERGLIKSRDELFITSKLWCSDAYRDLVVSGLQRSLRNLKLEYLDLYIIHWPVSSKPGIWEYPIKADDFLPMDFKSVWEAMEECQRLGLTKSIGVSNFSCKKLAHVLAVAKIPPAVNQVEMNPFWQQKKLVEFCKANGVTVTAYAPLGRTTSDIDRLFQCDLLKEIANKKGKTLAQVCLRWILEQGVSLLVKSFHEVRMRENLEIFDWELIEEESKKITEIPQSRGFLGDDYISSDGNGPIKSLEELWDGEI
ncbi:NADP-dependent oxidoreductase domain [Dillenia turbinata]|uniref:NADP-dependent oxidoreductase domain n=1 Tax=Dillenia turbinata TaxID=194707 RepID=A0AAN8VJP1_9MAGN